MAQAAGAGGIGTQGLVVFDKDTASQVLRILLPVARESLTDAAWSAYRRRPSHQLARGAGCALKAYGALAPVSQARPVSSRHGKALTHGEVARWL